MATLQGQVVIVTGASAGIGEAAARRLGAGGARVVLCARRLERLKALQSEIETAGGRALAVAADVTSPEDRRRIVDETLAAFSRIDGLVNNAGYGQRGPLELIPIEEVRRNFETNVFSLLALTQLVMPVMRKQGSGRIINISSVAGKIARPLSSVYDSTKHALEALSDGMRGELAPFGVKVVIVEPGFILTEFSQVAGAAAEPITGAESAYSPFFERYDHGFDRMRKMAGKPDDIARVIELALTAQRPKLRYVEPGHAKLFVALKRLLPERLIDYITTRQLGLTAERLASSGNNVQRARGES